MKLINLIQKHEKKVIGVLSGTSIDAVDIVLLNISGNGIDTNVEVLDYEEFKISEEIRKYLLKCSHKNTNDVEDICKANFVVGHLFADCINDFLKIRNITNGDVDLIGSHGQTIYHIPDEYKIANIKTKSTLQIGDPSVISNVTGITTVGDFRNADVAVGGDGAPLVPYLDFVLYRKKDVSRILLNIGGIANLTYLKKDCSIEEVIAFDCGPGNMMIDNIVKHFYNIPFDKNSELANSGILNDNFFELIKSHDEYYKRKPPKSTGREYYGNDFVNYILYKVEELKPQDIIKTVTEYTAFVISYNINNFIDKDVSEILVSGGGAENPCIMNTLKKNLSKINVKKLDENGITTANKEAVLFAVLANETISGNSANMPNVTGAKRKTILGKICPV